MNGEFEGLRFLILDQDEKFRTEMNQLLKGKGASQIFLATDGTDGLQMLKYTRIDVVICGANMQPLGGRDFTRIVRRDESITNREIPIILATKNLNKEIIEDARDSGVNDILSKPMNNEALLKKVLLTLNNHRAFIDAKFYAGPDRRYQNQEKYNGNERRDDAP